MMSKILEGMARAYLSERHGESAATVTVYIEDEAAMRAALEWLANNVSDEMVKAASNVWKNDQSSGSFEELLKFVIAAALQQAAGGEG